MTGTSIAAIYRSDCTAQESFMLNQVFTFATPGQEIALATTTPKQSLRITAHILTSNFSLFPVPIVQAMKSPNVRPEPNWRCFPVLRNKCRSNVGSRTARDPRATAQTQPEFYTFDIPVYNDAEPDCQELNFCIFHQLVPWNNAELSRLSTHRMQYFNSPPYSTS